LIGQECDVVGDLVGDRIDGGLIMLGVGEKAIDICGVVDFVNVEPGFKSEVISGRREQ